MLELSPRALVDIPSSSARHGLGLFETVRVRRGVALRLGWHLERLALGAAFLRLDSPPGEEELLRFAREHLGLDKLASGVLRLYAFDGLLLPALAEGLPPQPASSEAAVATVLRRSTGDPLTRFKTLSYAANILLAREAEGRGLAEVVALNEEGRLADGGRTNLFVLLDGELLTPPVADGALPGIARRALLEAGLVREAPLSPADLARAEAAFLANALRLAQPLSRLEGRDLDPLHPRVGEAVRFLAEGEGA